MREFFLAAALLWSLRLLSGCEYAPAIVKVSCAGARLIAQTCAVVEPISSGGEHAQEE